MKKVILTLALSILLIGCSNDENTFCPTPQSSHWELLTLDTQDNLIRINNQWLHNSNLDFDNWQYLQSRGFYLDSYGLKVVACNGDKILDASLMDFNYDLYITRPNDSTVVFYSSHMGDYISGNDIFNVNLKVADE